MKSLVWRGDDRRRRRLLDRPAVRARHLRADPRDHRARAVAGDAGGVYASHMRNEGTALEESIRETIRVGEAAGCARSDLAPQGGQPEPLGRQREGARADRRTRARAASSSRPISTRTPRPARRLASGFRRGRSRAGRTKIAARLNDPATWAKIKNGDASSCSPSAASPTCPSPSSRRYRADPSLNGLSMKQVAAQAEGQRHAPTRSSKPRATMMLAGGASMVYHFMSDDDVERIMRHPQVGVRVRQLGADAWARACRTRAATATTRACSASTSASAMSSRWKKRFAR